MQDVVCESSIHVFINRMLAEKFGTTVAEKEEYEGDLHVRAGHNLLLQRLNLQDQFVSTKRQLHI